MRWLQRLDAAGGVNVLMWGDTEVPRSQLVARTESLAELAAALETGPGAVVVGPAGIGKTTLIRAAAADTGFHLVNIRGSQISGQTPFGALAWLISDLPAGIADHPVQLLPQLEGLLSKRAGAKQVLLLLDNAEHLDAFTAMAVAQLVRRSAVRVLATAETLAASAADFLALWRDGLLHRIDLAPFAFEETRTLMESILGGRVSSTAAQSMQSHCGGNPHLIRLATPAQIDAKSLVQQDGIWALAKPVVASAQVGEVIRARLKRLAPQERSLIELLALSGGLPLPVATQLVGTAAVEALEEERMVDVTDTGTARLADHSSSSAIAGSVPPGRSRALWEAVSGILDADQLDSPALAGFAGWSLACRGALKPATAFRAACLANAADDPVSALSLLRSVPAGRRTPDMVLEEVRALTGSGAPLEALKVLERLEATETATDQRIWTALLLHKAELLRLLPSRGDPWEALRGAAAVQSSGNAGRSTRAQETALLLTGSTLAVDTGRLQDVPVELGRIPSKTGLPAELRAQATALRAQILAQSGRADEALPLLEQLAERTDHALPPRVRNVVNARTFQGLICAGELRRAAVLTAKLADGGSCQAFRGSSGEVASGLVHALGGRADNALRSLTSAISQLRLNDPADVLPLAQVSAAYVCSLLEDNTAAKQYLADAAEFVYPPSVQAHLLAARMRLQAELAQDPEALRGQLRDMARNCLKTGMVADALDCLTAAARTGDREAAQELAAAAASAGGPWARAQFCFGAGMADNDPALLLESAQQSLALQNHLHCHAAASTAQGLLHGRRDRISRAQARDARRLEHLSFRELRDSNSIHARLETLTPFEADLARRAAGPATREDISGALNLSPRTIDWHLGKIFDKLRVSGRAELVEVLS